MATNDRIDLLFSKVRKNIDLNVEVIMKKGNMTFTFKDY